MADEVKEFSLFYRKDTKRWVLTVPVDGNDWRGKRRQRVAPPEVRSKSQAKEWAETALAEGDAPLPSRVGMQVSLMVEKALKIREGHPDVKPATLKNNKTHCKTHIGPTFGALGAMQVGVPEARAFVRKLRESNSPNHVRNIFSTARTIWDIARAEGWTRADNPFRDPQVVKELPAGRVVRTKSGKPLAFPIRLIQRLVVHEEVPVIRRVKYLLAVTSGERDGELCGLRFSDVELDALVPFVRVEQALALHGPEGHATVSTPKTEDSKRPIPLHPATLDALRWWKDHGWERFVRKAPRPEDFVFPREDGKSQRPRSAELARKDVGILKAEDEKAGVPFTFPLDEADFHATRRTFSSALKAAKVPEDVRGKLMGHRGKTVGSRHYDEEDLAELAEAVALIPLTWEPPPDPGVQTPKGGHTRRPLASALPLQSEPASGQSCDAVSARTGGSTFACDFLNRWSDVRFVSGAPAGTDDSGVWCAGTFSVRTPNGTPAGIPGDRLRRVGFQALAHRWLSRRCDEVGPPEALARFRALSAAWFRRAA